MPLYIVRLGNLAHIILMTDSEQMSQANAAAIEQSTNCHLLKSVAKPISRSKGNQKETSQEDLKTNPQKIPSLM